MRGGAQSHLMRCSDGHYYVVKFQNNPQHPRVLVNEMLGTELALRLGLPTTPVRVIHVSEELIHLTPDLCIEMSRQRIPCRPGAQFGSRYPGDPHHLTLLDFLPDPQLTRVENLHDFAGMLVFDKWTCNTNGRQTLFRREGGDGEEEQYVPYRAIMIDQGFCFNAGEWNFPDAPLRGLYARNKVYEGIIGRESFEPWLDRLQRQITERTLDSILQEIPPDWYDDDIDSVTRLAERLMNRRGQVPELLFAAKNTTRRPFPNWI
ncbi:MAG TPA: HipA family kinase [Candidatus Acidoferrum sp.]